MFDLKLLNQSAQEAGEFFQNLFQQSSDALLSLPTEVKVVIVVVLIGMLLYGFGKKIFKLVWFAILCFVIYILLVNLGVI